jgi:hypothetical protein
MTVRTRLGTWLVLLLCAAMAAVVAPQAFALIMGGEGNSPLNDPGWPKGAAVIFNTKSRIAYWEGPPLGGGQWHAECRGDAKAISAVLADFAKLDVKSKRVVVHDGVGQSFWLNLNKEAGKRGDAAKMDWSFMVWQPASWEQLRKLPADLNPIDPADAKNGPPSQIDVYTGGNIKWADVTVPKELKIGDQRLEAHGFKVADGIVLEGKVTDLATKKPVVAKMRLQRVDPQKGGYEYPNAAEAATDKEGRWVLKNAPAGWHRVVIEAIGYVPRVAGYVRLDDQPQWQTHDCGLARAAVVSGLIKDDSGKPLAGVDVRFGDVTTESGGRYQSPNDYKFKTGADGRFRAEVPVGKAAIWLHLPGYIRPGLGEQITTPKENIELSMMKSARIVVTVDFTGKERPSEYIVSMTPEGGEKIGSYGGSGNINAKNQMTFESVPPGKYMVHGRPNPGSDKQQTEPIAIDPKSGQAIEVRLVPK